LEYSPASPWTGFHITTNSKSTMAVRVDSTNPGGCLAWFVDVITTFRWKKK
jgi:hypothetical protein